MGLPGGYGLCCSGVSQNSGESGKRTEVVKLEEGLFDERETLLKLYYLTSNGLVENIH